MFGFLPQHEATELWFAVQTLVETSCQGGVPAFGLSTDIVKAFNNLPRWPLLRVAAGIGFPHALIRPWADFLQCTQRRFMIHGSVSQAVDSTSGFPEGDPMSPVAMLLADLIFHRYLQVYAPSVRSWSYVDNLAVTAGSLEGLARGYNLTVCFSELLDLELDQQKTFVWSTCGAGRKALLGLDFTVAQQARELGGVLSYSHATRNALMVQRCLALAPAWQKLRRSKAPKALKLSVLPLKFWARGLHGIAGCPLAASHVQRLRAAAMKALGFATAGTNAMLRLSLAPDMTADPGFYELWSCVCTFRRMLRKISELCISWRLFIGRFDGQLFHGPFSKMLQVLSTVGWQVWFQDHDGLRHNLLLCPKALLRRLLEEAWLQHVGHTVLHRKTMRDLKGLDAALLRADWVNLSPLRLLCWQLCRRGQRCSGSSKPSLI